VLRLRVLGAVDLLDGEGKELRTLLAQPKRLALLAYLALAAPRGAHRRDKLLALFWPEHDAEHARNALSQAVHFLRRTMGADAVVSRGTEELALDTNRVWCDVVACEKALDAGRVNDALELYRGDLFEAFHVADTAPEFERWLDAERKRLALRYASALEQLAAEREAAGDVAGSVSWWRRLAARDPYSSRTTLRLMRALAAAGDPAGAIQHARIHETLLRGELGVAPDAEIAALVQQLQSARAAPRAATPVAPRADAPVGVEAPGRRNRAALVLGFAVLLVAAGGALVVRNGAKQPSAAGIRSLAVLPLVSLSGDSSHQRFADGMHDALITELARYPDLSVISRTSVMRYRGQDTLPLPAIARELKVDGIVEGTLVWESGRVRMNAQLVHGPSDRHLWAESYARDLRDVLVLQSELAAAIARQVRVASKPVPRTQPSATGPAGAPPQELYLRELYLRGRHLELSRSLAGVQAAREAYRRAVALDSTFALGYVGLAAVYGYLGDYNYAPVGPALDTARMMAQRAFALDSTLPETHTALAVSLGDAHQFEAAEREFKRAIELGPSNARAHFGYSILLVALGRGEEGLRVARRGMELDPFSPRGGLAMERYATWLVTGDRPHFRLPVRERRPILQLEPGEPWARAREAVELAMEGRCDEGRVEIERAQQLAPGFNFRMLAYVGQYHGFCGEEARTRAILARMKRHPEARNHGFRMAWLHTQLGEKDSAFAWLNHHRWTMAELSNLSAGWNLDSLRSDPRYLQLMRRLGIRKPS
jgi:DNA-binding SARP family transcriptional activator/TolB-like protein